MKVSELAKALHLSSSELLVKLKALRVRAASATSTLDADAVNRVRKALTVRAPAKKAAPAAKASVKKSTKAPPAKAAAKTAVSAAKTSAAAKAAPTAPSVPRAAVAKSAEPIIKPARPVATAPSSAAPARPAAAPSLHLAPAARGARAAAATLAPPKPKPPAPVAPSAKPAPSPEALTAPPAAAETPAAPKRLELRFPVTVKDLAQAMGMNASELIKYLMQQKIFASLLHPLNEAVATKAAQAFHWEVAPQPTLEEQLLQAAEPDPAHLAPRAPVVTFMGHVDHGKTSLLDAIREAKVAEREAGGITQHIGAYEVLLDKGRVTFLDTPGHEAFSALRARGANITDIVVLVVAADDGVMPQTVEAINHANAADVPIVVAMNKMDKAEANPQKLKQQLTQHGLIAEDWGGKTIMVPVSARSRQGIDQLLEMLLLEAELLELKADPTCPASGAVIEAKQTKDRGPVATLLVQHGTLRIGETIVIGHLIGRVRAMVDDRGHRVKEAGPSKPIEVLGLPEVPQAGDRFLIVPDDKLARQLAEHRQTRKDLQAVLHPKRITLEELHQRIAEGKLKELRLILKADVQGSLEAIVQSLQKLDAEKHEVSFKMLHIGVGDINESDVILAAASDAIVVGFHVGVDLKVQVLAATQGVDLHIYQIIYELVGAIKAAIEGLLEPTIEELFVGRAEVRKIFPTSKGLVAGCMVTKGSVRRDCTIRVIRGKDRLAETTIGSLKRLKDDAREVQEGVECGVLLAHATNLQVGDLLEAWELKKVARKLD
ncbi:MAG: translation initiation factor IF-2 [Candidatus Omnitrophica bacterium]|nr:translation initiation factor IF-2 [Candidatus Omnitrophota bacterium]